MEGGCYTENGAVTHASTFCDNLDLFTKAIRNIDKNDLEDMCDRAWYEDPKICLRVILNTRDCRGGKGERDVAYEMMRWLKKRSPQTYTNVISLAIPEIGRYDDLLKIALIEESGDISTELYLIAKQLVEDTTHMELGEPVSLCAKWAPSQGSMWEKKHRFASKIAYQIFRGDEFPMEWKQHRATLLAKHRFEVMTSYRKEILSPLRKKLALVECNMSGGKWDEIEYPRVPSKAMMIYRKAFEKHSSERMTQYIEDLGNGKASIRTTGLMPHEIVKKYMDSSCGRIKPPSECCGILEAQWSTMVDDVKREGSLGKTISIVDVSASMEGVPMCVAIAMGLFTSHVADISYPFYQKVITFTTTPTLFTINGKSLYDKLMCLSRMSWGCSTNLHAALRLVLDTCIESNLDQDDIPEKMIVYTDMQFDAADSNIHTSYEDVKIMFEEAGYKIPAIVFWNLRPSVGFAVEGDTPHTAILSGFSKDLVKGIVGGITTPIGIMCKILEPYAKYDECLYIPKTP